MSSDESFAPRRIEYLSIKLKKKSKEDRIREVLKGKFIGMRVSGDDIEVFIEGEVDTSEKAKLKDILEAEEVG